MANEEHVAILKQGVEVWNRWRKKNPTIEVDLSKAILNEADLVGANLHYAYLYGADLSGADISESYLREANLSQALLYRVNLYGANMRNTNLQGSNLSFADLTLVNFAGAYLPAANLTSSQLRLTNLSGANMAGVNLTGADLSGAILNKTELNETNLSEVILSWTVFGSVDLSKAKGLERVKHNAPSTIGIDTIYNSHGNIPEIFLRGAGIPDTFITSMKSLTGQSVEFYSCFISHSSKDRDFVARLYADLQSSGVRCWYAPEDLKIGEPFLLGIDQGIRLQDKLLLVLSENSVGSGWVQHEVLSAMAKEEGKAPWVLFPIRLDNAVMETPVPWANMIRQSRHVGDFTHWKDHDSYKKAFDRLLRDLKGKP